MVGIVFAKDVLKALHQGKHDAPLAEVVREAHYVPESKKVADLLREMQREKFHMALVTDEYGSVTGLVSLEDLLEELVGEITDEYDREEPEFEQVGDGRLPRERQDLDRRRQRAARRRAAGRGVGHGRGPGARLSSDASPTKARSARSTASSFRPRRSQGRRIASVLITRTTEPEPALVEEPRRDLDRRRHGSRSMIAAARDIRANAYAPYSGFHVGAALLAGDRDLHRRSTSRTRATRVGLRRAERDRHGRRGRRSPTSGRSRSSPTPTTPTPPCGACRQVLYEFGTGMAVIAESADGSLRTYWSLDELLAGRVRPGRLPKP